MPGPYAKGTTVSVEKTVGEIRKLLTDRKAERFATYEEYGGASIMFEVGGKAVKFDVRRPDAREFRTTATGRWRDERQMADAAEQEYMRRWRVLLMTLKMKFEAIEAGVAPFDQEFLPWMLTQGGQTVYERMQPALAGDGLLLEMPRMLTQGGE